MEKGKINLSNAEWRLMDFLWDNNPASIADMVRYFDGITNWDRHVVIMMLRRMEAKGAVVWEMVGRAKHYYPVIEREQSCVQETNDFLNRVYKGSLGLMLTTMVKQEKFKKEELEELRRILNEGEQDG
ncbi:MAG: BlaI/MecI/CopY family transcriptional regulator [Lachnospiraceae bacterium]|jgi:BlaI family penicillinase repressor|nr:BlaI/MecI/CopY family transcriptional regulator [Lachnospiraceae bacterium]